MPGTLNYTANAHIKAESPIFQAWKREYIEWDKMFRVGGLMWAPSTSLDGIIPAGTSSIKIYKDEFGGEIDNLFPGDQVTLFDTQLTAATSGESAEIGSIDNQSDPRYSIVNLVIPGTATPYSTRNDYYASPSYSSANFPYLPRGNVAGMGAFRGCQSARVARDSCYLDADPANLRDSFADGYVEFVFPTDGAGAVPYVGRNFWDQASDDDFAFFSQRWFKHFSSSGGIPPLNQRHNYFHLVGVSTFTGYFGFSNSGYDYSYVYVENIESNFSDAGQSTTMNINTTVHELAHQFDVDLCATTANPPTVKFHDLRKAWCDVFNLCGIVPAGGHENCVMNPGDTTPQRLDGVDRFCVADLLTGDPGTACDPPSPDMPRPGAIRTTVDPY
jgi:hypothetical protein